MGTMFSCAKPYLRYQISMKQEEMMVCVWKKSWLEEQKHRHCLHIFSRQRRSPRGVQVKLQDLSYDSPQLTQDVRTSHIWSPLMKIFILQTKTNIFNRQEYSFKVFGTLEHLSFSHLLANQIAIVCDFMSLQDCRVVFRDSRVLYHSLIVYAAIWIVSHCPPAFLLYNTPFSQHFFAFSAFRT